MGLHKLRRNLAAQRRIARKRFERQRRANLLATAGRLAELLPMPKDREGMQYVRFGSGAHLLMKAKVDNGLEDWRAMLAVDPEPDARLEAARALEAFGAASAPASSRGCRAAASSRGSTLFSRSARTIFPRSSTVTKCHGASPSYTHRIAWNRFAVTSRAYVSARLRAAP